MERLHSWVQRTPWSLVTGTWRLGASREKRNFDVVRFSAMM